MKNETDPQCGKSTPPTVFRVGADGTASPATPEEVASLGSSSVTVDQAHVDPSASDVAKDRMAFVLTDIEPALREVLWKAFEKVYRLASPARPMPSIETAREMWLTTPAGSFGRRNIQVEQYEELRALACRALGRPFQTHAEVAAEDRAARADEEADHEAQDHAAGPSPISGAADGASTSPRPQGSPDLGAPLYADWVPEAMRPRDDSVDRVLADIDGWLATNGPVLPTHLASAADRLRRLRRPDALTCEVCGATLNAEGRCSRKSRFCERASREQATLRGPDATPEPGPQTVEEAWEVWVIPLIRRATEDRRGITKLEAELATLRSDKSPTKLGEALAAMPAHYGPDLDERIIPESSDVVSSCSNCHREQDEPHTWEECAKHLAAEVERWNGMAHDPDNARRILRDVDTGSPETDAGKAALALVFEINDNDLLAPCPHGYRSGECGVCDRCEAAKRLADLTNGIYQRGPETAPLDVFALLRAISARVVPGEGHRHAATVHADGRAAITLSTGTEWQTYFLDPEDLAREAKSVADDLVRLHEARGGERASGSEVEPGLAHDPHREGVVDGPVVDRVGVLGVVGLEAGNHDVEKRVGVVAGLHGQVGEDVVEVAHTDPTENGEATRKKNQPRLRIRGCDHDPPHAAFKDCPDNDAWMAAGSNVPVPDPETADERHAREWIRNAPGWCGGGDFQEFEKELFGDRASLAKLLGDVRREEREKWARILRMWAGGVASWVSKVEASYREAYVNRASTLRDAADMLDTNQERPIVEPPPSGATP